MGPGKQLLSQIHPILEIKKEYICRLLADLEAFAEAADRAGTRFMVVNWLRTLDKTTFS